MPIEQHPIPQDVTGYKFRLVGDMTLTQFLQLAGGIIGGLIFYALPLPFFFKYPLATLSVGLGVGMAFVPVQGRPMGQWILAFIKSIYSPTMYVWQKQAVPPAEPQGEVGTPQTIPSQPAPQQPQVPTPPVPQPAIPETPKAPPTPQPQPPLPRQSLGNGGLPTLFTPTTPNTLTGMTLDPTGRILEDVIIELQKDGLTARATKSNKLGQFMFINPLDNGIYHIITEKPGFIFQQYALNLTGQVISPLKLQANSAHEQTSN